jgi:hypothetical protein
MGGPTRLLVVDAASLAAGTFELTAAEGPTNSAGFTEGEVDEHAACDAATATTRRISESMRLIRCPPPPA